jgi:hypothetical protein
MAAALVLNDRTIAGVCMRGRHPLVATNLPPPSPPRLIQQDRLYPKQMLILYQRPCSMTDLDPGTTFDGSTREPNNGHYELIAAVQPAPTPGAR